MAPDRSLTARDGVALVVKPGDSMRPLTAWRLSVLTFALACALLAALGWMSYRRLVDLREAARSVEHTLGVRGAADVLLSLIKDAETGQRGFLVTGDSSYLQPYESAAAAIPERLERLRQLTIDNRSQQEHLVRLDGLIRQKLDELNATIDAHRSGGPAAAARIVLSGEGKQVMDRIRTVVAAIRAEEDRLLSERVALEDRRARAATYTTLGGLALALALLIAATILLNTAVRARGREQAARMTAEAVAAAIAESETRFRVTLASIGDAIIATDDQGRVTLMNGVAEALTGWTRTEAIGRPIGEIFVIVNEESCQSVESPVVRVLREGQITGLANHTVLVSKVGREIPIDDSAAPIRAGDDRLVGVVMVFRDITERRHAERERAALLEREHAARTEAERVARILRHVQMVTDAALGDVSLDGLMREFLAHVLTTIAGDTATILLLAEDGTHLVPVSSDGLREELVEDVRIPLGRGVAGRIAVSEAGMVFHDLTDVEVLSPFLGDRVKSLVGAPLRVGNRLIGVVHVGASVPHRFTEEDLKLLGLVADRVALIIERVRLHEAERVARHDAETANRAKDEFLATVSHELRAPLSAIASWAQVLRAGKRDEVTVVRALETIERNVKLQERLISDLLDVSQIVTGRFRLDIEPVDLVAVIEAAIDVVRPAADAKGVRLESVLDPSARFVSGDPARLQQVLWNLLSNAVKFTPKGGRVEVRLRRVDSQAELAVSDTGEGISAEFLPHVFERFRQADLVRGRRQAGLGLGLAIVRHLVELHGGTVHAGSPGEGQGATFTVKLPLAAVRVPVSGVEGTLLAFRQRLLAEATPVLGGVRVLVVEDEVDARELLRTILEASAAVVMAAGSAAEALEVLERERPEVLVSDIAMPGDDGYALIRKVRALPPERGGWIPAVAVTAHARAEDRTRALVAGFQLHVPKPVEPAELVAVVVSLIARAPGHGTPGGNAER